MSDSVEEIWLEKYNSIHEKCYEISMVKKRPSEWVEENIILPDGVSRYKGPFSYRLSPYAKEIVDTLASDHPLRAGAIMKCAQIGLTQGLIVPGMAYIIAEDAYPMLFMAGDKELAKVTIQERFDPIMQSSGLQHLIRPSVVRAKNQRTGDTSNAKEYAGGRLTVEGTNNVDKMRQISVKIIWADDWEAAPRSDKKEGSLRKLMEGRQTSYGNMAKTYFVSTPTVKQTSNIEPVYLLGDQRKWHWTCPHCEELFTPEWRTELPDGTFAGIVWELDPDGIVIPQSVKYKCPHCKELIPESMKYDLNLAGKWIPTAKPKIENYYSWYLNALVIPPGFINWVDLTREWLEACPPGQPVDKSKLQTFLNIRMGQTWEEVGEAPKMNQLMQNTREYPVGVVPDKTSVNDGSGRIVLLTLSCDLNGIMSRELEDVRLDWELKAHSANGQTYSVEHGSIGTFKRTRTMSKNEREREFDRYKMTYQHGVHNSVWPEMEELMRKKWKGESGREIGVNMTVIDTGNFTQSAMKFIHSFQDIVVVGIKGRVEQDYRKVQKDTPFITRSRESRSLYLLEVNQIKDIVADSMKLVSSDDGFQPEGFMNFPQPSKGLYTMKDYFSHFESEKRIEDYNGSGDVIGFKWNKVHSNSQNHFWDVHIYNIAAKEVYLDIIRRTDTKLAQMTWADFVSLIGG